MIIWCFSIILDDYFMLCIIYNEYLMFFITLDDYLSFFFFRERTDGRTGAPRDGRADGRAEGRFNHV